MTVRPCIGTDHLRLLWPPEGGINVKAPLEDRSVVVLTLPDMPDVWA